MLKKKKKKGLFFFKFQKVAVNHCGVSQPQQQRWSSPKVTAWLSLWDALQQVNLSWQQHDIPHVALLPPEKTTFGVFSPWLHRWLPPEFAGDFSTLHFSCWLFKFELICLQKVLNCLKKWWLHICLQTGASSEGLNCFTFLHKADIPCDLKNCLPNDETACLISSVA